jgi:histidinol-phosphate aminotransferase
MRNIFENKDLLALMPYKLSSHKVWEIKSNNILKLDWNESTVQPSQLVYERIFEFLDNGNLNWYPNTQNSQLLDILATYTGLESSYIQYFSSSDSIHEYISRAFIDSGDNVLIVSPTYDNFRVVVESAAGKINLFNLDENFNLDFEILQYELNQKKYKLCYICNPNNPTGSSFDLESVKNLILLNPNILFLIDEAYFEFSNITIAPLILKTNNLIVTRTFSKAFGLASFRIGYMLSCSELILSMNKIRNAKNIPMISQIAACAAIENKEYMNRYVAEVISARKVFESELSNVIFNKFLKIFPSTANFILIRIFENKKGELISFLESRNIFVRDVSLKTLTNDYIRITIGTRKQMLVVIENIKEFYFK